MVQQMLERFVIMPLKQKNINVDFFCDSSQVKQKKLKSNIKIISPEELNTFDSKTNIFISNNYISSVVPQLKKKNFSNIYDCVELLEKNGFFRIRFIY